MSDMKLLPEWHHQSAVLIAWPHQDGDFKPWLEAVESNYAGIAKAILQHQSLIIACHDAQHEAHIRAQLAVDADHTLKFVHVPYDDIWVRDTAPLTLGNGQELVLLDFRFNAWGGKYDCSRDQRLAAAVHASGVLGTSPLQPVDFVLEGGSIETDGHGTLLTTSFCLLNPNRNPEHDKASIENMLRKNLGIERVLWVEHGKAEGDDTDAHIDTLARFCDAHTLTYTACHDHTDSQYDALKAMEAQLATFVDRNGAPYRLLPLPIPAPIMGDDGSRLPATYANFLIINGAVLVPIYGDTEADAFAIRQLEQAFPDHRMIPVPCEALIRQFGSLHCMTMQFPDLQRS
ncbi:MAG: hypothetical protein RIQ52_1709 [Pseudomonadota bacterium]|jgi:agmatine/peptidylarginine deiminase